MADFVIKSLRGGMNDWDPPSALDDDQCTLAQNVEFNRSMLGERRRGSLAIDLSGSALAACNRIVFLHRHLPTTNESDAQLWAMGITDPSTAVLAYKDTTWHTVTMSDAPTVDGVSEYQVVAQTLHGKLFIAYNSAVDRLHVWDGSTFRRTGLTMPAAAPTGANTGSGSFVITRYYRVRFTTQVGGVTTRRSEPSAVLTFAPSGSGSGVVVTKPANISEGETHWELEASTDNSNFYRIATTVIGTATVTDSQDGVTGYAVVTGAVLSETSGDYTDIYSAKFLTADRDRLLVGGSWEDAAKASRVSWTPVFNAQGSGNDERIPIGTNNFLDLDGYEGGPLMGMSSTVNGYVYPFKQGHIYQLVSTGLLTRAYEVHCLTKKRGALMGSISAGLDQAGGPALYFLDPTIGPCRLGAGGLRQCGADLLTTWRTVNVDATKVVARAIYYPDTRQVHWWIATGSSNIPTVRIVLQTNESRDVDDGVRRGWSYWDGDSATALAVCLFSDNIDAGIARNKLLKPFLGLEAKGLIQRTDTGITDNGTTYSGRIVTKPYVHGNGINLFEVKSAILIGKAMTSAALDVKVTQDFGIDTKTVPGVSLTPVGSETQVIQVLSDLKFAELRSAQVEFKDVTTPLARWELNYFTMRETSGG